MHEERIDSSDKKLYYMSTYNLYTTQTTNEIYLHSSIHGISLQLNLF